MFSFFKNSTVKIESTETSPAVYEMRKFDDVKRVASELITAQRPIIIDISRLHTELKCRVMDFLNGVSYTVKGSIERINDDRYRMAAPTNPTSTKKI